MNFLNLYVLNVSACYLSDYTVKFSIKSFKIPELFIDVPETATVGSLKVGICSMIFSLLKINDDERI